MLRILVFSDLPRSIVFDLLERSLQIAVARTDIRILGLCTAQPEHFAPGHRRLRKRLRKSLARLLNDRLRKRHSKSYPRLHSEYGLPLIVPPDRNPNHPQFIRFLQDELRPDVALCYYSLCVFKQPLLTCFSQAINYHDGLLPRYRGLMATAWSIYRGERESGFTFHRMNEALDDGNILIQDRVEVPIGARLASILAAKQAMAARYLSELIDMMVDEHPGHPQDGLATYFSGADTLNVTRIAAPQALDSSEFERRLAAFGTLLLPHSGCWYPVTAWTVSPRRLKAFSLPTKDRLWIVPTRIDGLPPWLYRLTTLGSKAACRRRRNPHS